MLTLQTLLDCPACDLTFDAAFNVPTADTLDELADPPDAEQVCPACGHEWVAEYPGWAHVNEA